MPRRGSPVRLAVGIYRHATFIRVTAKVHGVQREAHFQLGTDLDVMKAWQAKQKGKLLERAPKPAGRRALLHDIAAYLDTLPTGRRKKDDRALLAHWSASPLGTLKRTAITRSDVKAQLARWEEHQVAASSINHRLRALRNLYRELNTSDDDPDPTVGIKKRPEPEPQDRSHSYDLMEAIIAFMPDRGATAKKGESRGGQSLGKARARVMLWTGLPPKQLGQIRRADFDAQAGTLRVTPRRKGKGTKATTIPLLPQAVNALTLFFAAQAEGPFSTSSFHKQWTRAQARLVAQLRRTTGNAKLALPRHIRPYDLRHSFASEAARLTRNILGIRKLMLHAKTATTERYLEGAVDESASAVIDAWRQTGA